jgi:hypothetical protein
MNDLFVGTLHSDLCPKASKPGIGAGKIQEVKGMAGKIKQMIDTIISQRAKDNTMLAGVIKTKLMLKGIDPSKFTSQSPDDPAIISKLEALMKEL